MIAFVPGSFDPITNGHLDIIKRAAALHESVVVAVLNNSKKNYTFNIVERLDLINQVIIKEELSNVKIVMFDGLLANLVKKYCYYDEKAVLIKGLRTVTDFEYELQMAHLNKDLGVETNFMLTSPQYSYISSSMVREVAKLDGDFERYVSPIVVEALKLKLSDIKKTCINNAAATDQLTVGKEYQIAEVYSHGRTMYVVSNDKNHIGKYEINRFE